MTKKKNNDGMKGRVITVVLYYSRIMLLVMVTVIRNGENHHVPALS